MSGRATSLASVAVSCFIIGASAAAEEFTLGGRSLVVEPPSGFCSLDRRAPAEGPLFDGQEKAGDLRALALQTDCRKLDAYRAGEIFLEDLYPSILVFASLHDGEPVVHGLPRDQFNEAMEAGLRGITEAQIQEMARVSSEIVLGEIRGRMGPHYADATYEEMKYLGVLGRDETAVYVGQILQLALGDEPWEETSVAATTLINGVLITVSYSGPGNRPETAETLMSDVRSIARDLIALNEGNL